MRIPAFLIFALVLSHHCLTPLARAADPDPAARKEAAERFDRGLALFNQGDNPGALAEFKRAYELSALPVILFNIGLVYAEQRRPVDAVEALEKVLATPGALTGARRSKAEKVLADQSALVATVDVRTNVPAVIDVDGIEVARTPLPRPIRIASGTRVMGAVAPGYLPSRQTLDIAGRESRVVTFALLPGESAQGQIKVISPLDDMLVTLDGKEVGRTPLAATIAVAPGPHKLGFRRPGYLEVTRDVNLGEGATADVEVNLEEDRAQLSSQGGYLSIDSKPAEVVVRIDGRDRGPYRAPLLLPPGRHRVEVIGAGFAPFEGPASVTTGQTSLLQVRLLPTADTVMVQQNERRTRRIRDWAIVAGGVALAGGGGGYYLYNQGRKEAAESDLAKYVESMKPGGECDKSLQINDRACEARRADADTRLSNAQTRGTIGLIAAGAGLAIAVAGIVLVVAAPGEEGSENAFLTNATPVAFVSPNGWGVGLGARF